MFSTKFHQVFPSALLAILFSLLVSACGGSSAPAHRVAGRPNSATSTKPCAGNVARLFFHRPGGQQDGVRCVEMGGVPADQGLDDIVRELTSPATQVYQVCAGQQEVVAGYDSTEDLTAQGIGLAEEATGEIWLDVPARTCRSVFAALNEESMSVTDVWFNPFFGGKGSPGPLSTIHQVACLSRTDFFRLWNNGGKPVACYADTGVLILPHPLVGIVQVCDGNTPGSVSADRGFVAGIFLEMGKRYSCVTTEALLHEPTIMVSTIDILPVSLAA